MPKYSAWLDFGFEIASLESIDGGSPLGLLKGETGAVIPTEKGH